MFHQVTNRFRVRQQTPFTPTRRECQMKSRGGLGGVDVLSFAYLCIALCELCGFSKLVSPQRTQRTRKGPQSRLPRSQVFLRVTTRMLCFGCSPSRFVQNRAAFDAAAFQRSI